MIIQTKRNLGDTMWIVKQGSGYCECCESFFIYYCEVKKTQIEKISVKVKGIMSGRKETEIHYGGMFDFSGTPESECFDTEAAAKKHLKKLDCHKHPVLCEKCAAYIGEHFPKKKKSKPKKKRSAK